MILLCQKVKFSKLLIFGQALFCLKMTPKTTPVEPEQEIELKTAPFDPRYPYTNQTRRCYQNYLDFYRCEKTKGEGHEMCTYFEKTFRSLCPNAWIDRWNDQRETGTFPGKI